MKDQFTTLLSDVIQHQIELKSGFETIIHHVRQSGDVLRANAPLHQLEQHNVRVTVLANALADRWPNQPDGRVTPV
ncbi:hypothetical protein L6227_17740 [Pseudomonas syringae pv. syringae]|uniref:hypothetical protein n=1 Tax=Pseudomonas syringae TaxID=317 RepID=UPI001F0F0CC0|nr:hypothetical protein [Pseudomonas syringae]MCH5551122.1 hypothetical protein [Pseudomonas syringae pv. syringae]